MKAAFATWILAGGIVAIAAAPPQRSAIPQHLTVPHVSTSRATQAANLIANPTFATGHVNGGWYQCGSVPASVTSAHPYTGSYAAYAGALNGIGEPSGDAGICQLVTIPTGGVLTARLYQLSDEPDISFAFQEADLLDKRGNVVVNLYKTVNNATAWVTGTWNLGAYAGRTYWLYFGVHGDGYPKLSTQQYVGEVILSVPAK